MQSTFFTSTTYLLSFYTYDVSTLGYCISFELSNVEFDEIDDTFERLVISTASNSNDGLFIQTLPYLFFITVIEKVVVPRKGKERFVE